MATIRANLKSRFNDGFWFDIIKPVKRALFIMFGYPGSGKSYFARQLAQHIGATRISQDRIRKDIFENPREHMNGEGDVKILGIMNRLTHDALISGQSVVYDANVGRYADRALAYEIAAKQGVRCYLIWVKTPLSVALKRNGPAHQDREFERSYKRMVADYESSVDKPKSDEQLISISGEDSFERQLLKVQEVYLP